MTTLYQSQLQISMEHQAGENQGVREEVVPVPLCPSHIPHYPETDSGLLQQGTGE